MEGGVERRADVLLSPPVITITITIAPSAPSPATPPYRPPIVKVARESPLYRYAVVAVSSSDRDYSKCWRMNDVEPVLEVRYGVV